MERRWLGDRALSVPVLTLGTASFVPGMWSGAEADGARRLVDLCLDAGLNMFDTADVYADGNAEAILGQAISGRRDRVVISTKAGLRSGPGVDDIGSSPRHLRDAVERSLRRLNTDYIDLFQLHAFDACVPVEETMGALDDMVREGKLRQIGVSNYTGWQLTKTQATARAQGGQTLVAHQVYYSLIGRDYEWELMPAGLDQGISALVWSPLGWGRLTGRARRLTGRHQGKTPAYAPPLHDQALLDRVLAALAEIATQTGRTEAQIALNWLLQRPTVASLVIGVSSEAQLHANIAATGWSLTQDQIRRLDIASETPAPYPAWHQRAFPERNRPPVDPAA